MLTWLDDPDFLRLYEPVTPLEKELHRRLEALLDAWDEREDELLTAVCGNEVDRG